MKTKMKQPRFPNDRIRLVIASIFILGFTNLIFYSQNVKEEDMGNMNMAKSQGTIDPNNIIYGGTVNPVALKLEAHMQPFVTKWSEEKVPILSDLVVVDGSYFAIFNVDGWGGIADKEHYLVRNPFH